MKSPEKLLNLFSKINFKFARSKSQPLVEESPWLSEGSESVKDYILNNVLKDAWPKFRYGVGDAKTSGIQDGKADGETFNFQDNCRNAYRKTQIRVGKAIEGIVSREKKSIDLVLLTKLPNMEEQIERKIDRESVSDLIKAAEKLNRALRNSEVFLRERGIKKDSPQAKQGDSFNRQFWLYLLSIGIIEIGANYVLLKGAPVFGKSIVSIFAVVIVFLCGYAISWLSKFKLGVRIENNPLAGFQKMLAPIGQALCYFFFVAALTYLILYRAGNFSNSFTEILTDLGGALSEAVDLLLVIGNTVGLGFAIHLFNKSGSQIRNFDSVADEESKCQESYKDIRAKLDNQARTVFEEAIKTVEERRNMAGAVEINWQTIVNVCKDIPNLKNQATERIDEKYRMAIANYRENFATGRLPTSPESPGITNDTISQIPDAYKLSAPVKPLTDSNDDTIPLSTMLQDIRDRDYVSELDHCNEQADTWESANSSFDKLDDFAQQRIEYFKRRIRASLKADGIEIETTVNESNES